MWKDNDDKITDILDNIETLDRHDFPVACSICGEKEGHLYFHRKVEGDEKGGMWVWCSSCCPDYLEKNKLCIDEWVNKLGRKK